MRDIDKYKISIDSNIRDAVKSMDKGGIGFCVCINDNNVVTGVISDGDFRRAILAGIELEESVVRIMNRKFLYMRENYNDKEAEDIFQSSHAQHIPILNHGELIDIVTKEEYSLKGEDEAQQNLQNSVIIMAGGKGTRLDPFTRILPKPLIPLGHDPIIKVIMDEFRIHGMQNFYVAINDKGKMIKAYFHDHELDYRIKFIEETKPLGTAGALTFIKDEVSEPFFVSNCDIIVHCDYGDILKFHQERKNAVTLVGSMQHHTIPYGVCEIGNGGDLVKMKEKPEYDFLINTGLYVIEPDMLDLIPDNTNYDMTTFISKIKESGLRVGVFPVSEKSWIDIGQWAEYNNAIKELKV
jgi:dTDP-glucose pyrophosphorylase